MNTVHQATTSNKGTRIEDKGIIKRKAKVFTNADSKAKQAEILSLLKGLS